MSEKIARLGIKRDNDLMYYIKNGDVWATPRKQPGKPKGKAQKIESAGVELDYSKYIYFLDGDGDIARKARALGGGGRKAKSKPSKVAKPGKAPKTTAAALAPSSSKRGGTKSEAEMDRDIEECLAQARNGGAVAKPAGTAAKPAKKKSR